jgi:hypothetical protein
MALRSSHMTEEEFLKAYDKDKTPSEIAASLGVHRDTVKHWMAKLGLKPRYSSLRPGELRAMVLEHVVGRCLFESELAKDMDLARLGHDNRSSVPDAVTGLRKEGLIKTYMLTFSSNGASFGFYDIFDSSKTRPGVIVYEAGQDFLLGFKIASCLRDDLTTGKTFAIYNRFSKTLPKAAYSALKKYM